MKRVLFFSAVILVCARFCYGESSNANDVKAIRKEMEQMKSDFSLMMNEVKKLKAENQSLKEMISQGKTKVGALPLTLEQIPDSKKHCAPFAKEEQKIRITGEALGVVQSTMGNKPQDTSNAQGSIDVYFEADVCDGGLIFVDLEAIGNDGPDSAIGTFSGVNGDAGTTDSTVRVNEALYQQKLFDDKLTFWTGKIDLTNYFDTNAAANDENCQFLASSFVNSAVLDVPGNGPGFAVKYSLLDWLDLSTGLQSGDEDGNFVFDRVCWISEAGFKHKIKELEGNTRVYMTLNGNRHFNERPTENDESLGFGVSADQQITDRLTWFGRVGFRDDQVAESNTEWAWSTGLQLNSPLNFRQNDSCGIAFGQVSPNSEVIPNLKRTTFDLDETDNNQNEYRAKIESLTEFYYNIKISDNFLLTPNIQMISNPSGDQREENLVITGVRGHYSY